jgi:superfamily II RNA helicase
MPNTIFDQYKDGKEKLEQIEMELITANSNFKSIEYNTKGSVSSEQLEFYYQHKNKLDKLTQQVQALKSKIAELKQEILDFFKANKSICEVLVKHKEYPSTVPTAIKPNEDYTDITCMSKLG